MTFLVASLILAAPQSASTYVPAGDTDLTIYNQGFALVKQRRTLNLKAGQQKVAIEDVAQLIEPNSVGIRSISRPGSFTVLEQNYQYDLISPLAILAKAVGKHVTFDRVLPNGQHEILTGILLSAPGQMLPSGFGGMTYGGMVLKTDSGKVILDPAGTVQVDEIPEGLISKPTLMWELDADQEGENKIELSYLSQGMTWSSDYVLSLDNAGRVGDLKGWVTLNNTCGTSFTDANLKLLAGDVARVRSEAYSGGVYARPMDAAKAAAPGFAEEQFSDYHLYTLQRPATVRNNEQKQVSLLEAVGVPIRKRLVIDPMQGYYGYHPNEGEIGTGNLKPQIRIEFTNDEKSHLGMPLPKGKFKVFQRDKSGSLQMLGEDEIQHTPKNEKLSLVIGRAFDVVADRKRTNFQWLGSSSRGCRQSFEIEVRNRKETAESVDLIERFWGEWKITKASHDYEKTDAESVIFHVALAPNEVKKIIFTVENYW